MNIERPTSNVEWEKKKTYDLEERLLIIAGDGILVYFNLQHKTHNSSQPSSIFDILAIMNRL
ncbi:MAG: hypothetical protein U9N58_09500 [Thermodesulfobacteriota bacterium]|nr:hypothetical protein [Thermodesulfobacteriota bacterium]